MAIKLRQTITLSLCLGGKIIKVEDPYRVPVI